MILQTRAFNRKIVSIGVLNSVFKPGARRPTRAWFLKVDPVRIVGMHACVLVFVCPRPRLSISSGVMWRDIDLI